MQILRRERYASSIEECRTLDDLRDLLRVIASAGLSEQEFSALYSALAARKRALLR
jgi:hypothetical protein